MLNSSCQPSVSRQVRVRSWPCAQSFGPSTAATGVQITGETQICQRSRLERKRTRTNSSLLPSLHHVTLLPCSSEGGSYSQPGTQYPSQCLGICLALDQENSRSKNFIRGWSIEERNLGCTSRFFKGLCQLCSICVCAAACHQTTMIPESHFWLSAQWNRYIDAGSRGSPSYLYTALHMESSNQQREQSTATKESVCSCQIMLASDKDKPIQLQSFTRGLCIIDLLKRPNLVLCSSQQVITSCNSNIS